jgi:hypothetical protein
MSLQYLKQSHGYQTAYFQQIFLKYLFKSMTYGDFAVLSVLSHLVITSSLLSWGAMRRTGISKNSGFGAFASPRPRP